MDKPITQKQFQDHCRENEATALQLEKLMPLVDLIPTLNEIVENQKATVYMGRKVLRMIGYISAVIGLLYLIFQFWKEIK
jgi:hypothetical protein